jgi:hypothetical protein
MNVKIPEIMEFNRKSDFIVFGLSDFNTGEVILAEGIYNVTFTTSHTYLTTDKEGVEVPNFVYEGFPA